MKDSQKGWIPCVVYFGKDRFNEGAFKFFVKSKVEFLEEFELKKK